MADEKKQKKERVKKEKPAKKVEEKVSFNFADMISKITVTKNTPHGLLAEWQKEYSIDNCLVIVKLNEE